MELAFIGDERGIAGEERLELPGERGLLEEKFVWSGDHEDSRFLKLSSFLLVGERYPFSLLFSLVLDELGFLY